MANSSQPNWLSAEDVAHLLRCSVRTIWRMVDNGRLPRPHRLGRLVRWEPSTLDASLLGDTL